MTQAHRFMPIFLLISVADAAQSGIFAGKVAKAHSRPYMASLQFRGHHSCGGILIGEDSVLTAAHCKRNEKMEVVLGAHDISKKEKSQQRIEVAHYYQYPCYKGQHDYDIMLLKLKNNATLNKYVKTIGLPKRDGKIPALIDCAVAGWGHTGAKGAVSNVLKETVEKMQFSFECKNKWGEYFNSAHMMCTTSDRKKGGVCQGDSGGPLICNSKPQGLTAFTWSEDCSDPKYPHVFMKVNYFIPWIKEMMQKSGNVA